MKNVTIRISELTEKMILSAYPKTYAGATKAVEAYPYLRRHSLDEIKGAFTREEIVALVDSLNGLIQESNFQANVSISVQHLEDFEKYDRGITRHGADDVQMIRKISRLTSAQVYFLQEEIRLFWEKGIQPKAGDRSLSGIIYPQVKKEIN